MKKPLILIFFCSLFTDLSAQTLEGIWFSSSRMEIQERIDSTYIEGDEIFPKKLDKVEVDTFYFDAYSLIHFLNDKEVIFKGISGKKGFGSYIKTIDTISVEIDTIKFKLLNRDEKLILLDLDSGLQNSHFIFEKMLPLSSLSKDKMEIDFKKECYWKVNADSNSMNQGLELHFLDSRHLILSQFYDNWNASTSLGEYTTAIYENNLFLYFIDLHNISKQRLFRIYSNSTNTLSAQVFEFEWGETPPIRQNLELVKATLPKKKDLKEIENSLLGEWFLDDTPLPFDTLFSEFKGFENQYHNLTFFKDRGFSISYGGVLVKDDKRSIRSKEITGTWEIGPTGRYVKLKIDGSHLEYMSIIDVTKNSLSVSMDTDYLDIEMTHANYPIRFEKGANKK